MVFPEQPENQLPSISQAVRMIEGLVDTMPIRHRMPYDEEVDENNVFLLNRTASGLFNLKPNITTQPCLYHGENSYKDVLRPKWSLFQREDILRENILREEFELVMESHPLYRLFLYGIPTKKKPIRIINPFGNALAYGFPTPMLPLTSSLDVALFFATHRRNDESGLWIPIPERDEHGNINVGVIYVMVLAFPFPMMLGLSCVGMQAFRRPGEQKLFALNMGAGEDFNNNNLVVGIKFRQNPSEIHELERIFNNGELLTPNELIADKANEILTTHCVSEMAFERNCRNNPRDNHRENRKMLEEAGVRISSDICHLFTEEELMEQYYPTAREDYEEMFSHVVAVHPGFDTLLNDIRNFPNTVEGHKFFRL